MSHTSSTNERRLGLFGHVARLRSDVPANSILRICAKTRDVERSSQEWRRTCGRPSTTWVHQICRDTGVSATEALLLAEDKMFWQTIATAGGSDWSLHIMIDWLIVDYMGGMDMSHVPGTKEIKKDNQETRSSPGLLFARCWNQPTIKVLENCCVNHVCQCTWQLTSNNSLCNTKED